MGWMSALIFASSYCQTSFAFSSHFDSDGPLLSELSWPSSLAVVAVSFSGLITIIFLMLACLCCKKGDIGFKELDNVEGEDYTTEFSVQSSPAPQNGPEVYVLPLTEVSVPMSKQPGRSVQLLKSTDLGRQSLLYLKEIGRGWFGKVLLGEVNSGLASTQVVVKELKVSASVQEQMLFLEETQPYRVLQHPNLLQCLAQCTEITPYLLVMEFCPLGDLKGYLQSCAASESTAPDPLTLQRMGCEVCCGLLHLHKNNYTHSDLALRNCLLTADMTVKIGDYGLAHSKYRDDYLVTSDQLWVPLRWIAPELIDEVHGNLLVVDQTKTSNIWSLGVVLWELFELGRQPYDTYSDRQVLSYVIKEQQLKLSKPQLKQLHSDRWYEVMQFCWLQPEQRPTVEEVHLLLSYLSVKGSGELEEEFEKRWNSMKPNGGTDGGAHHEPELSSYPLLEHFSTEGFHSDGDDVLTVTQTSQGLNFEYKWERGRHEQYPLSPGCQPYQDMYYTTSSGERLSLSVSPSGYDDKDCNPNSRPLELVPVLSARSPSVAGDYYIRIEEPLGSNVEQDYSPQHEEHSEKPKQERSTEDQSGDNSPSISLSMEPLLEQVVCTPRDDSPVNQAKKHCSSPSHGEEATEKNMHDCSKEDNNISSTFADPLGASPYFNHIETENIITSENEDCSKSCRDPIDQTTVQCEGEDVKQVDLQVDLSSKNSCPVAFSPHWASNISSNNNVSCEPQQPGIWLNPRSEDSQDGETKPYGPESWQIVESGEGDNEESVEGDNVTSSIPIEDQFYDAEEFAANECLVAVETVSDNSHLQLSSPVSEATDIKSSPLCSNEISHPLVSPDSEDAIPEQEMDPLGVCFIVHSEPPTQVEPTHDLHITEEDISVAGSQGASLQSLLEECCNLSYSKDKESPEKLFSKDFYQTPSDSDDEDTMELTSGVFTDLSSERGDTAPSFRSLQKQVGTPDSLDSLDMPSTASSCDAFSLGTYAPSAQHKALDSGYDTENYESPEFVLKEPQERETEVYYQLSQPQEQSLEPGEMPMSRSVSSDLQGLDAKNPYRDSAYFSDYDSFNREEEEEGDRGEEREQEGATKISPCADLNLEPAVPNFIESTENLNDDQVPCVVAVETDTQTSPSPLPPLSASEDSLLQIPPIIREESVDEGLGLECPKDSSLDKQPTTSSTIKSSSHRTFTLSPVQLCLTKACTVMQGSAGSITLTTGLQPEEKTTSNRESSGACHLPKCLSPPLIRKEGRVGDSTDEDEEDEESEDSDESDEELRCYNIQEHSEESEEEHSTVPIVIIDNANASHLRSLLKTPNFLSQPANEDSDRKKKAVSFYDDVTVYLFDQESPTLDVADQEFPELPSVLQEVQQITPKESPNHLLDGSFEWENELPVKPVKNSFITSLSPAMLSPEVTSTPEPVALPIQKPVLPVQLSRFSVSPTPVSRFSITHVADNAVGSLEDKARSGEKI
ncbi:serine/threonine-protein kinase LMTK1 isoform X2 [Pyxicephalus adspersus]|uniref:serine/threonine-protein kinase LMTK1 isoform X2 n=1 Tax=Pyxicephalus adspersus TaxID=30357 RepID=UPI003B5A9A97